MKTIEVKLAETEEEVAAGGWRETTTIHVHVPVKQSGAVVDACYGGSVLFFTNNPALRIVIQQALQAHEQSCGISTGSFIR